MRLPPPALLVALTLVASAACTAAPGASPRSAGDDGPPVAAADPADPVDGPGPPPDPRIADVELRAPSEPSRNAYPALRTQLRRLLEDPELAIDGTVSVTVIDDRGYLLLAHEADTTVLPASTMKLVVAAAALLDLGPDHRYVTSIGASAPPEGAGVLAGDLVVTGSGDPALATPRFGEDAYPDRPRTPLERLADAVAEAGITTVVGDVIGDPSLLADDPTAAGWLDRYLRERHARRASALTVDAGLEVTYHDDGRVIGVAADDPAATAAQRLVELLEDRGVAVLGGARSSRTPPDATHPLGTVESPPLRELLGYALRWSDNHLTDGIFRTLGSDRGGTWAASAEATRAALEDLPLDWTGTVLADGSGLSRDDRLTAELLSRLDLEMNRSELAPLWRELMAVAGESGTLRHRLRGTLADRRLLGKTGTLEDVRALTGSVTGADGRRYHLTVIGNDLEGEERSRLRLLSDEIALTLTEDLLGCARTYDEEAYALGERPAYTVRCPG